MNFELKCPKCGQLWSRLYKTGECIDCANGRVPALTHPVTNRPKAITLPVTSKIKPDPVVGANDAIELPYRADLDG
jgi:hypothetical protein